MPNPETISSNLFDEFSILLLLMSEVRVSDVLLSSLDKEIVIYCYDYEQDEFKRLEGAIKLWSFIVMMYIINRNIKSEKMIEKIEKIIKKPKILVTFLKSIKKILYVWLKDYDVHCRLLINLYPEVYNPKRFLMLQNVKTRE